MISMQRDTNNIVLGAPLFRLSLSNEVARHIGQCRLNYLSLTCDIQVIIQIVGIIYTDGISTKWLIC